ncbi:MAG: MFS transporter [Anaerolineales bacterium]
MIEAFSTQNVLLIDIATAALAILPLLFIPVPQPGRAEHKQTASYWEDLREGFQYVVQWRGLLGLTILAMILNFMITPSSALLPLVITKIFNGSAKELGVSEALFGVGMIAGGILLGIWGGFKRRIVTSLSGIIGIGAGCVMIGFVPADKFYLLLTANFIIGFTQVFANGPLMAILQSTVAPDKQGRVFSLLGAGATAMMPLSLLVSGPIADQFGIRFWFIFGGAVCILMTIIGSFVPAIMNIENDRDAALTPVTE